MDVVDLKGKSTKISFSKDIWSLIRRYQYLNDISNEHLIKSLSIKNVRTLRAYDSNPENIRLGQIDSFLSSYGLSLNELIAYGAMMR